MLYKKPSPYNMDTNNTRKAYIILLEANDRPFTNSNGLPSHFCYTLETLDDPKDDLATYIPSKMYLSKDEYLQTKMLKLGYPIYERIDELQDKPDGSRRWKYGKPTYSGRATALQGFILSGYTPEIVE